MTENQSEPNLPESEEPSAKPAPHQGVPLAGVDLSSLRLSQDFASSVGVKKAILTVPVRNPSKQSFVRVRAGVEWCFETAIMNHKEEREMFLVDRSLVDALSAELSPRALRLGIDTLGNLFIWPLRLPSADGRFDEWGRTALEAASLAEKSWIRVMANTQLGAFEVYEARGSLAEPAWPDLTMDQLLRVAFKDRFINSADHPIVRRLRGEL